MGPLRNAELLSTKEQLHDSLDSGVKPDIQSEVNEVTVIDFFTYFGECSESCRQYYKEVVIKRSLLLKRMREKFGEQVCVSIIDFDQLTKKFREYVRDIEVDKKIKFYIISDEEFRSAYFRRGFTHESLIVDSSGVIVMRGQLDMQDLQHKLETLLNGEKLSGLGTTPNGHLMNSYQEFLRDKGSDDCTMKQVFKFKATSKKWLSLPILKKNLKDLTQVQLELNALISWDVLSGMQKSDVTVHTYLEGPDHVVKVVQ